MNVIEVEHLSKLYRLGQINTGRLLTDFQDWFLRKTGKAHVPDTENDLWALKDVSFSIEQGEVLGIVGRNGAGKSTLLKILSKITTPTSGAIRIRGKIASLLEVGTGFHPELSGRENIFLNGAILGMTKDEIRRKFDEIIAFSGVEKFLDTPVKRYSSGMYVRLAFSVAAHLDPEILIIDEVLAVGDAEFQKKCLGKMKDVASEGRTVLFVSHNLSAVSSLCTKGLLLDKGQVVRHGSVKEIVAAYQVPNTSDRLVNVFTGPEAEGSQGLRLERFVVNPANAQYITVQDEIRLELYCEVQEDNIELNFAMLLYNSLGECVFDLVDDAACYQKGKYKVTLTIPGNFLNDGHYTITLNCIKNRELPQVFYLQDLASFTVEDDDRRIKYYYGKWYGVVRPRMFDFSSEKIS